jgi:hypothetical protein
MQATSSRLDDALVKGRDVKRLLMQLTRRSALPGVDVTAAERPDGAVLSARPGASTWGTGREGFRVSKRGMEIFVVPSDVRVSVLPFGGEASRLRPFSADTETGLIAVPTWDGGAPLDEPVEVTEEDLPAIVAIKMEQIFAAWDFFAPPISAFSPVPTVGLYQDGLPEREVPVAHGDSFVWYIPLAVVGMRAVNQLTLGPLSASIGHRGPFTRRRII